MLLINLVINKAHKLAEEAYAYYDDQLFAFRIIWPIKTNDVISNRQVHEWDNTTDFCMRAESSVSFAHINYDYIIFFFI